MFYLQKVLLKLILSELRYTIRSFNSLTDIYKHLSRGFSPVDDLKMFNDFFHFRSINRASLNEVEGDISDVESEEEEEEEEEASDEEDEDDDDEAESGLEEKEDDSEDEADDTDGDMSPETLDSRRSNRSNEEESESSSRSEQLVSIQSTLRRFNSTPEIPITSGSSSAGNSATVGSKASSKNNKWNG